MKTNRNRACINRNQPNIPRCPSPSSSGRSLLVVTLALPHRSTRQCPGKQLMAIQEASEASSGHMRMHAPGNATRTPARHVGILLIISAAPPGLGATLPRLCPVCQPLRALDAPLFRLLVGLAPARLRSAGACAETHPNEHDCLVAWKLNLHLQHHCPPPVSSGTGPLLSLSLPASGLQAVSLVPLVPAAHPSPLGRAAGSRPRVLSVFPLDLRDKGSRALRRWTSKQARL